MVSEQDKSKIWRSIFEKRTAAGIGFNSSDSLPYVAGDSFRDLQNATVTAIIKDNGEFSDAVVDICANSKNGEGLYKILNAMRKEYNKILIKTLMMDDRKEEAAEKTAPVLPDIEIPKKDRLISEFSKELADIIKEKKIIFFRNESSDVVEIGTIHTKKNDNTENTFTGFKQIKANRFITLVEHYVRPVKMIYNKNTDSFFALAESINNSLAATVLESPQFQNELPKIARIFTAPMPIINGSLTFPKVGYDERFWSWLPADAPTISDPEMTVERAKEIIEQIMHDFCFEKPEDKDMAIAALLTPFLRGLYSNFNIRTPIYFYIGNRENAGKDYLAGITSILYEGSFIEESPIANGERQHNNNDELKKKILSAFIAGRKHLHFSNNKGHIDNAVLEGVATSTKFSDRMLGRNEIVTFDNEIEFTLSGNVGVSFTPDFERRCRFIHLFLDIENANTRTFSDPCLQEWVKNNRPLIFSALFALVRDWHSKGMPAGSKPFASFQEWARICGGIMENAGYINPCSAISTVLVGGDSETEDMRRLFEMCYERYPEQIIKKSDIVWLLKDEDNELFSYLDLESKAGQTKLGMKITKYYGRILKNIRLICVDQSLRSTRHELKFTDITKGTQKALNS